jgi:hypothetical protein
MILLIMLIAVIVLVFALTALAMIVDWLDNARQVIRLTETEAAEHREREILAAIQWDTEHHPVEEPVYRTEPSS